MLCETRYIGIYLTAVMAITSISVVMTVIVLNCHYKGPTAKQVPRWMRRYVITSCGRLLLFFFLLYRSVTLAPSPESHVCSLEPKRAEWTTMSSVAADGR